MGECLWNVQVWMYGMQKGCMDEMREGKCVECTEGGMWETQRWKMWHP